MRYKLYREHKYISCAVNDVVRLIAKTDFTSLTETEKVTKALQGLWAVLAWHSQYEDEILHPMLSQKGVYSYAQLEADHLENKQKIIAIDNLLIAITESSNAEDQIEFGCQLYLRFRKFSAENLEHLDLEEVLLLPEFHRFYSDSELRDAEFEVYKSMSIEHMIHAIKTMFSYMNRQDRFVILNDIKICDAVRFAALWQAIQIDIEPAERADLAHKLS